MGYDIYDMSDVFVDMTHGICKQFWQLQGRRKTCRCPNGRNLWCYPNGCNSLIVVVPLCGKCGGSEILGRG